MSHHDITRHLRLVTAQLVLLCCSTIPAAHAAEPVPGPTPAAQTPAAPTDCELHVWPGDTMHVTYLGWTHGSTVDGHEKGRVGYPAPPPNSMSLAHQRNLLTEANLPEKLGIPAYREIFHDTRPDAQTLRFTTGRLTPGTPACYAELIVDNVFYQQSVLSGRQLVLILRFRDFDRGVAPKRVFSPVLTRDLSAPRSGESDYDVTKSVEEIDKAYASLVDDFAKALRPSPRHKG